MQPNWEGTCHTDTALHVEVGATWAEMHSVRWLLCGASMVAVQGEDPLRNRVLPLLTRRPGTGRNLFSSFFRLSWFCNLDTSQ